MDSSHAPHSVTSRWDMRTIMVIVSAFGALPMLGIAVLSPTFLKPGALPLLSAITCFTAVTVAIAAAVGRLTDRQFAVLGAGGMLGVALSAYVIADPAATRAVTAMLAIVPAISASASPTRITTALTTLAVVMATIVTATDLAVTGTAVSLIAVGAAATTVLIPVFVIGSVTRSLRAVNTQMQLLADTDPLTGLLNRRGMLTPTLTLLESTRRRGTGLRAALIDIDHFKTVNDTHGHTAGDRTLIAVADTLTAVLTAYAPADTVLARTGGEEFLLLTRTDTDPALETRILDRIRTDTSVTVSIGTVTVDLAPHTARLDTRKAGTDNRTAPNPDPLGPGNIKLSNIELGTTGLGSIGPGKIGRARIDSDGSTPPPPTDRSSASADDARPIATALDATESIVDSVSRAADTALYHAKTEGRDCIRTTDLLSVRWPLQVHTTQSTRTPPHPNEHERPASRTKPRTPTHTARERRTP